MGHTVPGTSLSLSPARMAAFPWIWVPREAESGSPEGNGPRRIDSQAAAFHCLNWSCGRWRPCIPSLPCGTGDQHVSPAQELAVPSALCPVCLPLAWELTWSSLHHQPALPRLWVGGCQGLAAGRAKPCASISPGGLVPLNIDAKQHPSGSCRAGAAQSHAAPYLRCPSLEKVIEALKITAIQAESHDDSRQLPQPQPGPAWKPQGWGSIGCEAAEQRLLPLVTPGAHASWLPTSSAVPRQWQPGHVCPLAAQPGPQGRGLKGHTLQRLTAPVAFVPLRRTAVPQTPRVRLGSARSRAPVPPLACKG